MRARLLLVLTVFAIPAWRTANELGILVHDAWVFRPAPDPMLAAIRARVPQGGAVDIVMLTPQSREGAVFLGAALTPRDVRFFDGWPDWKARRRAPFIRDSRAANAPPGPAPGPASLVVEMSATARIAEPR